MKPIPPEHLCPHGAWKATGCATCKEPAPDAKTWDQRECPHGYAFDCCTQCHDAFYAGRESMTPAAKMSFEERAREIRELATSTNPTWDMVEHWIASAFAEVAEEAKREQRVRFDAINYQDPAKTCTCGSTSVGSQRHSSWCDAATAPGT